jgi:hypothetical protein
MSVSMEIAIAAAFFVGWVLLAAGLMIAYKVMRDHERDTRLAEEAGRTPTLEVIGAGRIGRRQWSRGHGCRVSVYDDFFVVSVSSQRMAFPLFYIREIDTAAGPNRLTVRTLAKDESLVSIDFRGTEAERLADSLRDRGRGGAKVAPRA